MPVRPFIFTPEQMAGLEQLCCVLIAEFDRSGALLHGNAGLYRITAAKSASLWELFSQPQAETLLTAVPDSDGRIHSGLMTARGQADTMVSLTGSIYRDADRILVVAGYDMNEFEAMTQSLLDPNNRVNVAYRELARTNRKLEISEQEIRQLSLTDALTGVGNRRRLDEALIMEVDRSARHQAPLSLMILDIDHFKRVNDTRGHETGDRILKETGAALRKMARRTDARRLLGPKVSGFCDAAKFPCVDRGTRFHLAADHSIMTSVPP